MITSSLATRESLVNMVITPRQILRYEKPLRSNQNTPRLRNFPSRITSFKCKILKEHQNSMQSRTGGGQGGQLRTALIQCKKQGTIKHSVLQRPGKN
jgi:hypothetical protein